MKISYLITDLASDTKPSTNSPHRRCFSILLFAFKMSLALTPISQLIPTDDLCKIQVRIARLWGYEKKDRPGVLTGLEMIMIDDKKFGMTINKSQGQSLSHVGIYLPRPVFSHGQLYVAVSRVRSRRGLKILITNEFGNRSNSTTKTNEVYKEIFQKI